MSIVNKPLFLFFYRVLLLMILYKFSSNEINYQSVVPQGKLRKVINSLTMDVLHVLFHHHGLNHIHTVWNTSLEPMGLLYILYTSDIYNTNMGFNMFYAFQVLLMDFCTNTYADTIQYICIN